MQLQDVSTSHYSAVSTICAEEGALESIQLREGDCLVLRRFLSKSVAHLPWDLCTAFSTS